MPRRCRRSSFAPAVFASLLVAGCGASKSQHVYYGGGGGGEGVHTAAEASAPSPVRSGLGMLVGGSAPAAPPAAPGAGQSQVKDPGEMIVVEGWIRVSVDDVPAAIAAIGEQVRARGGRIIEETVSGQEPSWQGTVKLRVPPGDLDPLLDWLGGQGEIGARRIQGTDVSKEYFDQELALRNFEITRARLEKLLEQEGLETKDVLEIERELTRLRGEIEGVKGRLRFLSDRVALATVEITLATREDAEFAPEAKLRPGPRGSLLFLIDEERGERLRAGFGASLHLHRLFTLDLDVFPAEGGRGRALLATAGSAAYSDFLGRGKRRFLNPFLGYRIGYGHVGRSSFVLAAEAGVELFKHEYLLVEVSGRALALIHGDGADAALQTALTVNLPF